MKLNPVTQVAPPPRIPPPPPDITPGPPAGCGCPPPALGASPPTFGAPPPAFGAPPPKLGAPPPGDRSNVGDVPSRSRGAIGLQGEKSRGETGGSGVSSESIQRYLQRKDSPLAKYANEFVGAGEKYGIDPRLLVAISGIESGFGKNTFRPYNAWGWSGSNFHSWEQGIDTVAAGLKRNYLNQGLTSVARIQKKYCPVGASNDPNHTNSSWLPAVTRFMKEQGADPDDVRL